MTAVTLVIVVNSIDSCDTVMMTKRFGCSQDFPPGFMTNKTLGNKKTKYGCSIRVFFIAVKPDTSEQEFHDVYLSIRLDTHFIMPTHSV